MSALLYASAQKAAVSQEWGCWKWAEWPRFSTYRIRGRTTAFGRNRKLQKRLGRDSLIGVKVIGNDHKSRKNGDNFLLRILSIVLIIWCSIPDRRSGGETSKQGWAVSCGGETSNFRAPEVHAAWSQRGCELRSLLYFGVDLPHETSHNQSSTGFFEGGFGRPEQRSKMPGNYSSRLVKGVFP